MIVALHPKRMMKHTNNMNRIEKLVGIEEELEIINLLAKRLKGDKWNSSNSVIITVSTDYSSIVGQILRHELTWEGEICEGFGIDVPYPDEEWNEKYVDELSRTLKIHSNSFVGKTPILVEAGVIRGGNYTFVTNWMKRYLGWDKRIVTLAMYENIESVWKSDYVGEYYNDKFEDLTFWWERENRHWK